MSRLVAAAALALALAGCKNGTISPQTQAEIQAAEQLGACVEGVYAADSQKVPAVSPVQVVIDEGAECGADLSNLVTVFGSTPTPAQSAVLQAAHEHAAEMANARLRHGK